MSDRPALPSAFLERRVVAVARGRRPEQAERIAAALYAGGIRILEITMDSPGALESIAVLRNGSMLIGAGTVMSREDGMAAVDAGASFVVSPHLDAAVVDAVAASGVPVIPGGLTPSEIVTAWGAGASAVKVFPSVAGGPEYLRALRGPLGHIPLIPTGGVTLDNARAFLDAGAVAIGLGGWLTGPDPDLVRDRAERLVAACS